MSLPPLSDYQLALVESPAAGKRFLEGPAGAGKTTAGVAYLMQMLVSGVPARSILVLVPQRVLATPYYDALRSPDAAAGAQVTIFTIGGLAQRMVDLFWPLVARDAGFAHPECPPVFLTLETAQYYMARLVRPLLDQGYFDSVVIDRNRLYSQILDNLNKAAAVGFPYTGIGARLKAAWGGDQSRWRIYDEAQECANRFRAWCLAHNLLDFSLQLEVFRDHLWKGHGAAASLCRDYLLGTYTHLIADNLEEDIPLTHDILREWLPHCHSALLIYDWDAGYRRFLGADPEGGYTLSEMCDERITFASSLVTSPGLENLGRALAHSLNRLPGEKVQYAGIRTVLRHEYRRYYPQMLDWIADEVTTLVREERIPPGEIVVLAPFLSDALRFSLMNRLEQRGIPSRSHRPSRALRDEPATRCLLTLAALAHPSWGISPSRFDVAYAMMQAIEGLDLVRAQLLADIVYRIREGKPSLSSFDQIMPPVQERLTFVLGGRYQRLYEWLQDYQRGEEEELDHFLARLFGEVLSQEGYGFHTNYDAARVAHELIESVRKFRWAADEDIAAGGKLGQEYLSMVQDGVIAAQYVPGWQLLPEDAVLLAPAYTFLMYNRPVEVQFWVDVGEQGWWERLAQPLTHPYVLSRHWPLGKVWGDGDEVAARNEALSRLALGLLRRCRRRVYLAFCELSEQGYEQKGALLMAVQRVLRRMDGAAI